MNIQKYIEALPEDCSIYADKYFLRSKEILSKMNLNPWVSAQVFIRNGPGIVGGIDQAISILEKYGRVSEMGGQIFSLLEGDEYSAGEVVMRIIAPIDCIIALETMYLGVISSLTTIENEFTCIEHNTSRIENNMRSIVDAVDGRPVYYFGARHWHWLEDNVISKAAARGGAAGFSTDRGAMSANNDLNSEGIGTIPHALENIFAWALEHDEDTIEEFINFTVSPVVASTMAFNEIMDKSIPRIALIDYANDEINDSLDTLISVPELSGIRIDTCGENIGAGVEDILIKKPTLLKYWTKPYWYSNGVSILGTLAVREALNENNGENVKITLSSGFGNLSKVKAFLEAEKILGVKLFDSLGVGQIYPSRAATMDITHVGRSADSLVAFSKAGRRYKPSHRLIGRTLFIKDAFQEKLK